MNRAGNLDKINLERSFSKLGYHVWVTNKGNVKMSWRDATFLVDALEAHLKYQK